MKHLEIEVKDGALVITMPVELLCHAVQFGNDWPCNEHGPTARINNAEGFAHDIVRALEREEEDGTTLVHRMFDKAAIEAIEQGAESIDLDD